MEINNMPSVTFGKSSSTSLIWLPWEGEAL